MMKRWVLGALLMCEVSAFAGRPRVAVVISDDLAPYEAPLPAYSEAVGEPVEIIRIHGREADAVTLLTQLRAKGQPEVVFAIGAKAAFATKQHLPSTPMVYAMVNDPGRYGIEGDQVTGVTTSVPPVTTLSEFLGFFPDSQKVGVLQGPNMTPQTVVALKAAAVELDIELQFVKVPSARELRKTFMKLAEQVDAVWLPADRDVITPEGFRNVTEEARRHHMPLIVETENMVRAGGLFSMVPDPNGVGEQAAALSRKILDGAAPAILEPLSPEALLVSLNKRSLRQGEIPFDPLMLDFVDVLVE